VVESQEGLWRRVWALVMRWLRWRTSSHHDAEDLAADCMRLAVVRFGRSLPPWPRLRPWALVAARHRLISFRRSSLRAQVTNSDCIEAAPGGLGDPWAVWDLLVSELDVNLRQHGAWLLAGLSEARIAHLRAVSERSVRATSLRLRLAIEGSGIVAGCFRDRRFERSTL
jgi:DNA-directed RNA polymerase specialized sigma24 family protein